MQLHSKRLIWIFPLLLLVIGATATYIYFPEIMQKGLQRWLTQQGYSNIELHIERPEWNNVLIKKLALVKETNDQRITIQSNDITLRFNPYKVISLQRVKLLELPKTHIRIDYKGNAQPKPVSAELVDLGPLLPSIWLPQIPANNIRIGELTLELNYPETTPDWRFKGSLQANKQQMTSRIKFFREGEDLGWADIEVRKDNHFHLRLLNNDSPFIIIDGALSFEDKLQLESTQLVNLPELQQWLKHFIPNSTDIPAIVSSLKAGSISLTGKSSFPLQAQLSPDNLLRSLQTSQKFTGNAQLQKPQTNIQHADVELQGVINFSKHQLQVTLEPSSSLHLKKMNIPGLTSPIKTADIDLKSPLKVSLNTGALLNEAVPNKTLPQGASLDSNQLIPSKPIPSKPNQLRATHFIPIVQPFSIQLTLSNVPFKETQVQISPVDVELTDLDFSSLLFDTKISSFTLTPTTQLFPPITLSSKLKLQGQKLNTQFEITSADPKISIKGKSRTDLKSNISKINWKARPITLSNIEHSIAAYFALPAELSIQQGTLFHNGNVTINNGLPNTRLYNSIRQANMDWDQTKIRGLNWDSATLISPKGNIRDKGSIKVDSFIQGIEANKISSEYRYKKNAAKQYLQLTNTRASLLEGDIHLAPFELDLNNPSVETGATLSNIDLGAILSLEQQQGLSGEGKLSGTFPITYKSGSLSIENGQLKALQPGGKIRFQPNAAVSAYAASNSGLKMALGALENFHYELLEVKLNYAPDGTAYLQTRLKGQNPDWHDGQRMDFNINIEENIPSLLKTLQFTDKLTETIEKRYR